MKTTRLVTRLLFSAACITAAATACVTVNVNFPEATVQKATDDYVRDLYRAKEKGRPLNQPTTSAPSGKPANTTTSLLESLVISQAFAAEGTEEFKVTTGKSLKIRDKLAGRLDKVLAQKRAGVLGETNDGLLSLDTPGGAKLKPLLKKGIQSMVSEENEDRKELYEDVLSENNLPKSRLKDIQKSFARSFQSESPSGTWVQDANGKWAEKP